MSKQASKNLSIEGLRAIAIIIIAFYHLLYKFNINNNSTWGGMEILSRIPLIDHFGELGVSLFLIISAYFLYSHNDSDSAFSVFQYYKKKLIRLWPTYFIAVSITFVMLNIFPYPDHSRSLIDYFLNSFWINGYIGTPYIDGAHWYMTVIISFIVVVGVIRKLKVDDRFETYIMWVLVAGVAKAISVLLSNSDGTAIHLIALCFAGVYKVLGGGFIGIGCIGIAYHIVRNQHFSLERLDALKCAALIIISTIYTVAATNIYRIVFAVLSITVIEWCLRKKSSALGSKVLVFIGSVSYPFYLIHQQLGYIIERQMMIYAGGNAILNFGVALGITFIIGCLIHYIVEKGEYRIGIAIYQTEGVSHEKEKK